jgi:hypothetical protein
MKNDYHLDAQVDFEKFLKANKINKKEKYTFEEIENLFVLARDAFVTQNTLQEKEFSNICIALILHFHVLPKDEKDLHLLDILLWGVDLYYYTITNGDQKIKDGLLDSIKKYEASS